MKRVMYTLVLALCVFTMSLLPAIVYGADDSPVGSTALPPIGQQLVREGDFAVKLVAVLGLRATNDEAVAESRLTDVGITPRNGWIADYPMTPDIIGEVYQSVRDAADKGAIPLTVTVALERLDGVMAQVGLDVSATQPAAAENGSEEGPAGEPPTDVINNYYYDEGPPVITYYAPPADYYYLYTWVPYPFWWFDFWYPGYYILNDFQHEVVVGTRRAYVTNHYRDLGGRWYGRIDPVQRFRGGSWLVRGNPHQAAVPRTFVRHDRGPGSAVVSRSTVTRPVVPPVTRYGTSPYTGRGYTVPPTEVNRGYRGVYRPEVRRGMEPTPSVSTPPAYRRGVVPEGSRSFNGFRGTSSSRMSGTFSMPSRGGGFNAGTFSRSEGGVVGRRR